MVASRSPIDKNLVFDAALDILYAARVGRGRGGRDWGAKGLACAVAQVTNKAGKYLEIAQRASLLPEEKALRTEARGERR